MRIVQAVFGVFHHFELAHQLHRRNHLQRIYSTWPWARLKREGLPRPLVGTFPLLGTPEYLLARAHFDGFRVRATLASWNALAFDRWTNLKVKREPDGSPDAFIAISGAGLLTGRAAQERGGKFICDRGSTHQRFQDAIVSDEYKRWGLPAPPVKPHIVSREEEIYLRADAITVPSTAAKRSFVAMRVAPEKVHVIPYGVRLDKFAPATLASERPDPDTFDVLFAGAVSLRKGIPYLLEAFALLKHPRKSLTIVGGVPQEIKQLLSRLPTDSVDFTGELPQPELARLMVRSHVLVLASVEEGLALVQGQALACGCPVIATEATGAEDLFTDGVEGFIVPDRDTAAIASRMQRLADDRPLRETMSLAALERVKSLGGWDRYGSQWDALLHELTGIAPDPNE